MWTAEDTATRNRNLRCLIGGQGREVGDAGSETELPGHRRIVSTVSMPCYAVVCFAQLKWSQTVSFKCLAR